MSQNDIPLVQFADNPEGIYLNWDRISTQGVFFYNVLKSSNFDGDYNPITTVTWPVNEYIDPSGTPTDYYKIQEIGAGGATLNESKPFIGEEELIKTSLAYQIRDFLRVPVHDEEVIFTRSRSDAHLAFSNWNYWPRPEIRITGINIDGNNDSYIILSENESIYSTGAGISNYPNGLRYKIDYNGKVYFVDDADQPTPIQSYDVVLSSYNVRMFTCPEMNDALYMTLQQINLQPGTTKTYNLQTANPFYDPILITGATYWLLRSLLVRLNQRETKLLLTDQETSDQFKTSLREDAKMYKETLDDQLKVVGKIKYPDTRSIVTPEFLLPGSRSRYFRYLWKGNA